VLVDEVVVDKPGTPISPTKTVRIKSRPVYVSRGGLKLEGALKAFNISPSGWVCADIGASTGGFTDCLLQAGAKLVYAVDVAYGILDWKLRSDSRVIAIERCNVRTIDRDRIDQALDLAVFDTSFISLTKVIPPVLPLFGNDSIRIVALVKPQFECTRDKLADGGIVAEESDRLEAVQRIKAFAENLGLCCAGAIPSPITGSKGNQEYLVYLVGGLISSGDVRSDQASPGSPA